MCSAGRPAHRRAAESPAPNGSERKRFPGARRRIGLWPAYPGPLGGTKGVKGQINRHKKGRSIAISSSWKKAMPPPCKLCFLAGNPAWQAFLAEPVEKNRPRAGGCSLGLGLHVQPAVALGQHLMICAFQVHGAQPGGAALVVEIQVIDAPAHQGQSEALPRRSTAPPGAAGSTGSTGRWPRPPGSSGRPAPLPRFR